MMSTRKDVRSAGYSAVVENATQTQNGNGAAKLKRKERPAAIEELVVNLSHARLVYINSNCFKVAMATPAIASQCVPFSKVCGTGVCTK